MQDNNVREPHIGVKQSRREAFSEVRNKVIKISKKAKRNKQASEAKHKLFDRVVVCNSDRSRDPKSYLLVEVIDIRLRWRDEYEYYGLVLKASNADFDRFIIEFHDHNKSNFCYSFVEANVSESDIKWAFSYEEP